MSGKFQHRPDRRAGPLLASSLVVLLGGLGVAVIVAVGGTDPLLIVLLAAGLALLLLFMGFGLRTTPSSTLSALYGWVRSRNARPPKEYAPRIRREERDYGTNQPPTADELRELKDGTKTWVPSSTPRREKPRGSGNTKGRPDRPRRE